MGVEVIIPASSWDAPERVRARGWVARWWESFGYRVTVAVTGVRPWSKGRAVNPAIAASDADVVIVADGDSWVDRRTVPRCVEHALAGRWCVPFRQVRRLTADASDVVLGCDPATVTRPPVVDLAQNSAGALAGGGVVVASRDTWGLVGGIDPRFEDWGGEDYSLGLALRTMTGSPAVVRGGNLWHLWHPPQGNVRSENQQTKHLAWRYRCAKFRPGDMVRLIDEWRSDASAV